MEQLKTMDFFPTALVISLNVSILPTPLGPVAIELNPCSSAAMTLLHSLPSPSFISSIDVGIAFAATARISPNEKAKKRNGLNQKTRLELRFNVNINNNRKKAKFGADEYTRNLCVFACVTRIILITFGRDSVWCPTEKKKYLVFEICFSDGWTDARVINAHRIAVLCSVSVASYIWHDTYIYICIYYALPLQYVRRVIGVHFYLVTFDCDENGEKIAKSREPSNGRRVYAHSRKTYSTTTFESLNGVYGISCNYYFIPYKNMRHAMPA